MVHLLGPLSGDSQLSLRFQVNQCQVSDHHYDRDHDHDVDDDDDDHYHNDYEDDDDDDDDEGVE